MRCIIVDDEIPAREELKYLLEELDGIEVIGEAGDGASAFEIIKNHKPDIAFLDIHMRGMSGFELANQMLELQVCPFIVFITAYDQYAIHAFEINAVDYVLKPVSTQRLKNTLSRIRSLMEQQQNNEEKGIAKLLAYMGKSKISEKISVYYNGKYIPISPEEIVYITVEDRNTIIKAKKGEFISSVNLSEWEEKLERYGFFRCHRSYLININEIIEIINWFNGTYQVTMKDFEKDKITVSRSNTNRFKAIMNL